MYKQAVLKNIENKINIYESMELPPSSYIYKNCKYALSTRNHLLNCRKGLTSNCIYFNDSGRVLCDTYKNICASWLEFRQARLAKLYSELNNI